MHKRRLVSSRLRSAAIILITTLFLASGCAAPKITPDPLAGWKFCYSENPIRSNKSILDDYQDYIQKLPFEKRSFFAGIDMYEDGTGQHAVRIKRGVNGTWWEHVLVYDKENKRVKVIKYKNGGYRS